MANVKKETEESSQDNSDQVGSPLYARILEKDRSEDRMTLVIYVPFRDGSIMISDRQNTYSEDLTREPIDKITILENFGTVLGFAGSTQQCRYLVDQLRRDEGTSSFEEAYRQIYQRCYGSPELGFRYNDVEFLTVTQRSTDESLAVLKILGAVMNEIDVRKCTAIGGGARYITPQLELNTLTISRESAEEFGLTLLGFTSRIDISVGDPITYGYNVAVIGTENGSVLTQHPQSVNIEKLLYHFDE